LHLRNEYGKCDGNFKYVPVLNNKNFLKRQGERAIFENEFFAQFFDGLDHQKIRKLTWSDISDGADLKNRMELANYFGQVPTLRAFARLRSGYRLTLKKCKNNEAGAPIGTYINSFKKGSKKLRAILSKAKIQKGTVISRQIRTFYNLVGTKIPETDIIKKIHVAWTKIISQMMFGVSEYQKEFRN
jgi:hypothetical protein